MKRWIAKLAFDMMGGVPGVVGIALSWFNDEVLVRIKGDETAAYCKDVQEFAAFLDGAFARHASWTGEGRRAAMSATVEAVRALAAALEDANVTQDELDGIVDRVKAAIAGWTAEEA